MRLFKSNTNISLGINRGGLCHGVHDKEAMSLCCYCSAKLLLLQITRNIQVVWMRWDKKKATAKGKRQVKSKRGLVRLKALLEGSVGKIGFIVNVKKY